jgi:glycolate oxidase iron-sulfur subunit
VDRPQAHSLQDDLARCVHCGFCLQACPTYVELGMETDSPRGRIALIEALASGRATATAPLLSHLDLCLQCRACETACPSGVPYGRIMETARAEIVEHGAPLTWRVRAASLRQVVARPGQLRLLMAALGLYQRSPLRRLLRTSRLLRVLPGRLDDAERSLPEPAARPFSMPPQPAGLTRTVAMLTGCVMPHLYPRTHVATVRVLNRLGYRVVAPAAQACCGALSSHAGDRRFARELARRNINAFLGDGVEAIIVNSAGCGAAMKEYGDLLADDDRYAGRARDFSAMTRDVLEFVAGHDLGSLGEVHGVTTYQDSCHLAHAQRVAAAPRQLLRAIPGLQYREMTAADRCCGSAGMYSFVQRAMSSRLLETKMEDVERTGASTIATANPGCMSQLEAGLRLRGINGRVVHVIELIDEAMQAAPKGAAP